LDIPKSSNDKILDYVDCFDKQLELNGGFSYGSSSLSISGTGNYKVLENAEDVEVHANIRLDKGGLYLHFFWF
jgi:hypothetical protein